MRHWRIVALVVVAVALSGGCTSDKLGGTKLNNEPPTVWLSSAPPEGTVSDYTLHLFWGGWDPDGQIAYYEYVITDNSGGVFNPADTTSTPGDFKWRSVVGNDSIFTFTADLAADSLDFGDGLQEPEEFRRSHTFFIRAVDKEGRRSAKPAYRSFTSRTLSPIVSVDVPTRSDLNPAVVPPITTFQWTGTDFIGAETQVQDPDSVRWIIVPTAKFGGSWLQTQDYIQTQPDAEEWCDWNYYKAPGDTGQFWTSPPLDFGSYVFAVQVKDEAGAVTPVFDLATNMRRITVSTRTTGPVLTVRNDFLGSIVTTSPNTPPSILDMPAGVAMKFEWEADASSYGGVVSGYRFGWDIFDLNDPEQWEVDFTPFIGNTASSPLRTFFFGSHTFNVEVVDNSGFKSRVTVTVNIVPFTMTRTLLLIDDWREGDLQTFAKSKGALPSDGEHDSFWRDMLSDVQGFDPVRDVFELRPGVSTVPIQVVADYQNIIWNASATSNAKSGSVLSDMIQFIDPNASQAGGKTQPNIVALFMSSGGHILLAGQNVMTMAINRGLFEGGVASYPMIFRYESAGDQDGVYTGKGNDVGNFGVGDKGFAYRECCLNVLDIAYIQNVGGVRRPPNQELPPGTGCPVNGIRFHDGRREGLRAAVPADLVTGGGFPRLELRPEVAGDPTRFYHVSRLGLNCDIYNPSYFADLTACGNVAELTPVRSCYTPIYTHECVDPSSPIFGATVAFWTSTFANRVPDVGGVAARSAVWGFQPVYFNPSQMKQAISIVVHDEWQIPRI